MSHTHRVPSDTQVLSRVHVVARAHLMDYLVELCAGPEGPLKEPVEPKPGEDGAKSGTKAKKKVGCTVLARHKCDEWPPPGPCTRPGWHHGLARRARKYRIGCCHN